MKNKAFTLIELLVVVLIIGILAAIAVPQYQLAVVKSRVSTVLPLMSSIVQAEEIFYMTNGEYTNNFSNLDIQIPAGCKRISDYEFSCDSNFYIAWGSLSVLLASYCPGYADDFSQCKPHREFQIGIGTINQSLAEWSRPGEFRCIVQNSSTFGKKVCKSLGEIVENTRYTDLYKFQ